MERPGSHYPILLDLSGRLCVVVGGGAVGARKARGLLASGARVRVVSPEANPEIRTRSREGELEWVPRDFQPLDVEGAALVFAATDSSRVNAAVREAAGAAHCLVNDAMAEASDFILPATLRRGGLQIAVSTGGGSPAYAKLVRERLAEVFGEEHGEMVALLERLRPRVMARFPKDDARRRAVWDRIVSWETLDLLRQGHTRDVEELITECLS